jgi:hypothetical protein
MSLLAYSPPTISLLQALFGSRAPYWLIGHPRSSTTTRAFEVQYADRAGFRLGANGEWVARERVPGRDGGRRRDARSLPLA